MFDLRTLNGKTFPYTQVWQVVVTQNTDGTYTATEPTNYAIGNPSGETATFEFANNHRGTIVWQESVPSQPVTWTVLGGTANEFLLFEGESLANGLELIVSTSTAMPVSGSIFGVDSVTPCFVAGTLIAAPFGYVPVESLAAGDVVLTAGGQVRRIVWMGARRVQCDLHQRPEDVTPIRITADAFGPGLPRRDLFVSPDHCLFLDGVLIPAKLLQNGSTVRRHSVASVTYCHVELSTHDVLLAEGLPAESYLDTGNRSAFGVDGMARALRPARATNRGQSSIKRASEARAAPSRAA